MGWGYGTNQDGKEIGYAVAATCDQYGCATEIDRGLGFACGGWHGAGAHMCDGYFCAKHLFFHGQDEPQDAVCLSCLNLLEDGS